MNLLQHYICLWSFPAIFARHSALCFAYLYFSYQSGIPQNFIMHILDLNTFALLSQDLPFKVSSPTELLSFCILELVRLCSLFTTGGLFGSILGHFSSFVKDSFSRIKFPLAFVCTWYFLVPLNSWHFKKCTVSKFYNFCWWRGASKVILPPLLEIHLHSSHLSASPSWAFPIAVFSLPYCNGIKARSLNNQVWRILLSNISKKRAFH